MRSDKIIKNSIFALLQNYATLILSFISRTVFIKVLGEELLGVNGLFSDIFTMLSLMELGIGSAITYYLYSPIACDNKIKITQILKLYGKLYKYIGILILIVGICIMPIFPFVIKDYNSIDGIGIIYLLLLLNVVASYMFAYKRALLEADQKAYINSLNLLKFNIVKHLLNIIFLILTRSYYLYLIINVMCTLLSNINITKRINNMYPYILESVDDLTESECKNIFSRARALLCHKIGTVVVFGTDNILLSTVANFSFIGKYSNYVLIINMISSPFNQIFNALTASVGNVSVIENDSISEKLFNKVFFVNFWLSSFCSISLFVLLNPFIEIWLGKNFTLSTSICLALVLNFFITTIRNSANYFGLAKGLFWNTRFKPLVEAVLNMLLSLFFIKLLGPIGVMLGTTVSSILTSIWIEPYVLYKNWFKKSPTIYFLKLLQYTFITFIIGFVVVVICRNISIENIYILFLIKVIILILVPNTITFSLFRNSDECKYLKKILLSYITKLKKK